MIADGGPLLDVAAALLFVFLLALVARYVLLLWLGIGGYLLALLTAANTPVRRFTPCLRA